jgi:hypothetical protein
VCRLQLGRQMPRAKLRTRGCQNRSPRTAYMHLLKIEPRSFIRRRIPARTHEAEIAYTDIANKISRSLKVIKAVVSRRPRRVLMKNPTRTGG